MDDINNINEIDETNETDQINEDDEMDEYQKTRELYQNLASRWYRLGAVIVDNLIISLIVFPVMYFTGVFGRLAHQEQMTIKERIFFILLGVILFLVLQGYLLFKKGQTIGKFMFNIKIVDLQGNVPNFGKLLVLRYFIFGLIQQIPFVGGIANLTDIGFIFGSEKRCLHDYLAGTIVVNATESIINEPTS